MRNFFSWWFYRWHIYVLLFLHLWRIRRGFSGKIKYSSIHPNQSHTENWTQVNDYIYWKLDIKSTGNYKVEMQYGCPASTNCFSWTWWLHRSGVWVTSAPRQSKVTLRIHARATSPIATWKASIGSKSQWWPRFRRRLSQVSLHSHCATVRSRHFVSQLELGLLSAIAQ